MLLVCFVLTAGAGLLSEGVYHEDDLKHFLFARWTQQDARYLIDEWGRPGFTLPYALPATIGSAATGWHACRSLSAVLSAATAWLAYRIARHYRLRYAWLAIPLLYLQPLFTHLSLTTLTETPLTFYFALATWLLLKHRPIASAAVLALATVTRHEAVVLLPIWALALARMRARWPAYPAMFWAMALHNLLAVWFLESLPIRVFLEPGDATHYGSGTPLTYVPRLLFAAGPVVVALALMGSRRLMGRTRGWLVVAAPALYFAAETVIYMGGAYASGGYARFLVPIAPWVAVLAAAGAQPFLLTRRPAIRRQAAIVCGGVLIVLWAICIVEWWWRPPEVPLEWQPAARAARIAGGCVFILLTFCFFVTVSERSRAKTLSRRFVTATATALLFALPLWEVMPLRLLDQHRIMRDAVAVLQARGWHHRPLIAVNLWLYHWTDRWVPNHLENWWDALPHAEPGTIFAWDARFCLDPDHDFTYAEIATDPRWRLAWTSPPDGEARTPFLAFFERRSPPVATRPTTSPARKQPLSNR